MTRLVETGLCRSRLPALLNPLCRLHRGARAGAGPWLKLFMLCWAWWVAGGAFGAPSDTGPVRIEARADGLSLVGRIAYLEDTSGRLDLAALRAPAADARFAFPADPLRGKESRRVLWFKLRLQLADPADVNRDWLLVVPSVSTHDMRFFGPLAAGAPLQALPPAKVTGMRHPYATRDAASERMAFRFRLPDTAEHTLYVRVESDFARIYAMAVWPPDAYLVSTQDKRLFDGLCYGIMLAMLLLAPSMLLVFRERIYTYYALSCAFALLSMASFNGHVLRYLFPETPWLAGLTYQLAPALWAICKLAFARQLLELHTLSPRLDRVVAGLLMVLALAAVVAALGFNPYLLPTVQLVVVASTLAMAGVAVAAARRRHWPSLFFIGSVVSLLAGISVMIVESWGWLSWRPASMDVMQVALSAELLIFAAALVARVRWLSRTARQFERRNHTLMAQLSMDRLTGVASRSRFEEAAQAALDADVPVAVMLLDLNGFKAVNDGHGHAAGDKVLRMVGERLGQQVRGPDLVARLGGDEFAVLVTSVADRATLAALGQRLIDAVARPVPHEGHLLRVSASLGVALAPPHGAALDVLMRAADQAMYAGKRSDQGGITFADEASARALRRGTASASMA